jgi:hypothetical protein
MLGSCSAFDGELEDDLSFDLRGNGNEKPSVGCCYDMPRMYVWFLS